MISEKSLESKRSQKTRSSAKSRSSTSSAKRAAIETATLKADLESMKRKQEIERKHEDLRRQENELRRLSEHEELLAELKGSEEVEKILLDNETEIRSTQNALDEIPCLSPSTPKGVEPVHVLTTSSTDPLAQIQRETTEIQKQQLELMRRMTLPIPKPPIFTGNILDFPKWESAFDALIDEESVKPSHKLYYLGEYTSGIALKMISGLIGLKTDDAYERARTLLKE